MAKCWMVEFYKPSDKSEDDWICYNTKYYKTDKNFSKGFNPYGYFDVPEGHLAEVYEMKSIERTTILGQSPMPEGDLKPVDIEEVDAKV